MVHVSLSFMLTSRSRVRNVSLQIPFSLSHSSGHPLRKWCHSQWVGHLTPINAITITAPQACSGTRLCQDHGSHYLSQWPGHPPSPLIDFLCVRLFVSILLGLSIKSLEGKLNPLLKMKPGCR